MTLTLLFVSSSFIDPLKLDHVNGFNVKFHCSMKFVAASSQATAQLLPMARF